MATKLKSAARRKSIRSRLAERDGTICRYCGSITLPLTIDHIIPQSLGGTHNIHNLQLLCVKCNHRKDSTTNITHYKYTLRVPLIDLTKVKFNAR